jgi:hypothetical protein
VAGGATLAGVLSGGKPPDSGPGVGVGVRLGFALSLLSRFVSSCAPEEGSDLECFVRRSPEAADFVGGDSEAERACPELLAERCLLLDFLCRLGVGLGSVLAPSINVFAEPFADHAGSTNRIGEALSAATHKENAAHQTRPMTIKLLITSPRAVRAAFGLDESQIHNFQSGSFRSANALWRPARPAPAAAYRCRAYP